MSVWETWDTESRFYGLVVLVNLNESCVKLAISVRHFFNSFFQFLGSWSLESVKIFEAF